MNENDWLLCASQKDFELKATEMIANYANDAIRAKGHFSLVLAGGNTPKKIYESLSKKDCDWSNWYIYFGDERCLPSNDKDRNSLMVEKSFFSKVSIPKNQINIIPAELGMNEGADAYEKKLNSDMVFDLVLLGLGEDGHTASIFPNSKFDEISQVVPISNAPKQPENRISLTPHRLSMTNFVIFLVMGKDKKNALDEFKRSENIPASRISALKKLTVLISDVN
ncbi:6-phosphogluconolactonase [Methylophilales bacterium]|nr:6-phosphogluconolactonase [Methylophilales bacterium]